MKRLLALALIVLIAAGPAPLFAEDAAPSPTPAADAAPPFEPWEPQRNTGILSTFLFTEVLLAANSYLASVEPRWYGGFLGLVAVPLASGAAPTTGETVSVLALGEGLAAYNAFAVDEDDMSEGEIFRNNLAGWHLFALGIYVSHKIFNHESDDSALLIVPGRRRVTIQTVYRF